MNRPKVSPDPPSELIWTPKQLGILGIFRIYGSVLPRCLASAVLGGIAGGLMEGMEWDLTLYARVWRHPYALHVFGMVLGFALVIRIQIAYQRFWEGAGQCHQAASKWADACMQVITFDEISKDAWTDDALEFRMQYLHYASLMHAVALVDMRQDDYYGPGMPTLTRADPFAFRPNRESQEERARRGSFSVLMSSGGEQALPDLTGSSARHNTVPLQMVLRTRKQMKLRHNADINSFVAVDAMEQAVKPANVAGSSRDLQDLPLPIVRQQTLKRGFNVSRFQYYLSVVFASGSAKTERELAISNSFEVLGGVSESEVRMLQAVAPGDRSFKVQTWLVRLMTDRLRAGGLAIPPPLLSRTYQVLSDGTAASMQAHKVSHVEFPFALRQLLAVLLLVFALLAPMCIAAFVDSVVLVTIISFFVLLGYVALNETARELEQPFGLDANDLATHHWQRDFNTKLAGLLDLSMPDLGYGTESKLENMKASQRASETEDGRASFSKSPAGAGADAESLEELPCP